MSSNVVQLPFCGKSEKKSAGRKSNEEIGRAREFLSIEEVHAIQDAAKKLGRHGHRDFTLILIDYRHGLRVSELCELTWDQIDLNRGTIYVKRLKNGNASTHVMLGDEIRALRKLQREQNQNSRHVFLSERKGAMSRDTIHNMIQRAGKEAGIKFPVHPHMLRHAKGYSLANKGTDTRAIQDYLGHKNIHHTVRYTQIAESRLRDLAGD
jgi:site-specific recombinase XerD